MEESNNQEQINQPGLSIQDLRVAAELINICTQRGAFRANELTSVGTLYDRLVAFVGAAEPEINSTQNQESDTVQS